MKPIKDSQLGIRINSTVKAQAQVYAESTGRTLAGLIEWLLKREMEANKK